MVKRSLSPSFREGREGRGAVDVDAAGGGGREVASMVMGGCAGSSSATAALLGVVVKVRSRDIEDAMVVNVRRRVIAELPFWETIDDNPGIHVISFSFDFLSEDRNM